MHTREFLYTCLRLHTHFFKQRYLYVFILFVYIYIYIHTYISSSLSFPLTFPLSFALSFPLPLSLYIYMYVYVYVYVYVCMYEKGVGSGGSCMRFLYAWLLVVMEMYACKSACVCIRIYIVTHHACVCLFLLRLYSGRDGCPLTTLAFALTLKMSKSSVRRA